MLSYLLIIFMLSLNEKNKNQLLERCFFSSRAKHLKDTQIFISVVMAKFFLHMQIVLKGK